MENIIFKYCLLIFYLILLHNYLSKFNYLNIEIMEKIKEIIKSKERKCFLFCPNKTFYDAVKINQKRWGQIYRGDTVPTMTEAKAIADYFEVDITELY